MNTPDQLNIDFEAAKKLLLEGNYPQAELHLRRYWQFGGSDPAANKLLTMIARAYGMPDAGFRLSEKREVSSKTQYLLIKAWGSGFWSDVHHVLGQLLLAELLQRTPIVHWGNNSLFRADNQLESNAFSLYFEPPSALKLADLSGELSIYPDKWTHNNLAIGDVNKWSGEQSRVAAQFMFNRTEDLLVSDFYMTVNTLLPWIAEDSDYFGKTSDAIYRTLYDKHLRPRPPIQHKVDAFYQSHMAQRNWIAVHARGSDKIVESETLHETNARYFGFVDRVIELNPAIGVFLLTDSVAILAEFESKYHDRLLTTSATRSETTTGVHFQGHPGPEVGQEVLMDALLACHCDYFVGNKESNVSLAISSLKDWPQGFIFLLGDFDARADNFLLHRVSHARVEYCRLCQAPVKFAFEKNTFGTHAVTYRHCIGCGALQASTELPPLPDAKESARTLSHFFALPPLLQVLNVQPSDYAVDFGNDSHLFTRLMRDRGFDFHPYAISQTPPAVCRIVTALNTAEQFVDPLTQWKHIFACDPEWVIGSTPLYAGEGEDWTHLDAALSKYTFFYGLESIAYLAQISGRFAYRFGSYFLLSRHPLETPTLEGITRWSENIYKVSQDTWEHWFHAPLHNAIADNTHQSVYQRLQESGKKIAIDGTFFRYATGIARVWKTLFGHWAGSALAQSIVVIDRGRTAPRLSGFSYVDVPHYDYSQMDADRTLLQDICDRENVGLFISTYYTIPRTTPSALLVLDMIPEVMGYDLTNPQWEGKRQAIEYATSFMAISQSTLRDLIRFHPKVAGQPTEVTYCGCNFRPASAVQVGAFKAKFGITRPYFLISGSRDGPKNALLFFKAFERLGHQREQFAIVCTNANTPLDSECTAMVGPATVHTLVLTDAELQCAYTGAIALAYPSRYEGFGLPVVEAMACETPAITCHNSSLPEVGGDAVIYVDPDSVEQMHQALIDVQSSTLRQVLVEKGRHQASLFSWQHMAREVGLHLAKRALALSAKDTL